MVEGTTHKSRCDCIRINVCWRVTHREFTLMSGAIFQLACNARIAVSLNQSLPCKTLDPTKSGFDSWKSAGPAVSKIMCKRVECMYLSRTMHQAIKLWHRSKAMHAWSIASEDLTTATASPASEFHVMVFSECSCLQHTVSNKKTVQALCHHVFTEYVVIRFV